MVSSCIDSVLFQKLDKEQVQGQPQQQQQQQQQQPKNESTPLQDENHIDGKKIVARHISGTVKWFVNSLFLEVTVSKIAIEKNG